jgi:tetratricopeptide (TPR) repeat protein
VTFCYSSNRHVSSVSSSLFVGTAKDPGEQDRFLSSVIRVLVQAMDKEHLNGPPYTKSSALARAYALRAQAKLDQNLFDEALQDAMAALEIVSNTISTNAAQWITTRVYRTMVDAYEAKGDLRQAMNVLQQWAAVDPTFSTKIAKELTRLRQLL